MIAVNGRDILRAAVNGIRTVVDAIAGYHAVPAADGADNVRLRDVVGNRTDSHSTTTLAGRLHEINEHLHSRQWVMPDLAPAVTATAAGVAWDYGVAAVIGTPVADFDLHYVDIVANNNAEYQAVILVDGVEISEFVFTRVGPFSASIQRSVMMPVRAGAEVTIQIASDVPGATADFKVEGHYY